MMIFKRCKFLIFLSLIVLVGCNKYHVYTLHLYENGVAEVTITDKIKIEKVDNMISNILSTNRSSNSKDFDIPKGFTYEVIDEDKIMYQFASGYLIYDEKVYSIQNYAQFIKELKEAFKQ